MRSFNYRSRQISAEQWGSDKRRWWVVVVNSSGRVWDTPYSRAYNVNLDHPHSLWRCPWAVWPDERWRVRTFEQALQNCLGEIDMEEQAAARAGLNEQLMEARLSLAEELTRELT